MDAVILTPNSAEPHRIFPGGTVGTHNLLSLITCTWKTDGYYILHTTAKVLQFLKTFST